MWTRAPASLRRHYPVRFRRSVARALRPATLSARLARAPVFFCHFDTTPRPGWTRARDLLDDKWEVRRPAGRLGAGASTRHGDKPASREHRVRTVLGRGLGGCHAG